MTAQLEVFLSELAKQPHTATGYYPSRAGAFTPEELEKHAETLESDNRVKNVKRQYAGAGRLIQLWVVLK